MPHLQLWGDIGRIGDPLNVSVPGDGNPHDVDLATPFRAHAATNGSDRFVAELYTGSDTDGEPAHTLAKGQTAVFAGGHDVEAIRFVEG
ncbi:hypothetical protein ACIBSV_30265 [Embleya sp. NPDC050154]|uniref:hypothetical protein n=1 Tax=unclassified Embleya TaxID=2699296 RepID=UPI0037A299D1